MTTKPFVLPENLIGRFAIVKLWPDIKTAEDECIARLKIAANTLGIECVEVHADGSFLSHPEAKASKDNVDFVLHLHYDTPKQYDAFSIVALWNPLRFYHEWGYERTSRNLTTHDDFVSCSSDAADNHVGRMIRSTHSHLPVQFKLYHSTADIIHPPSLGDGKLFYAGINWEAISGGKSRHQEVLKRLDPSGLLRIYGPTIFQGVKVWAGYESYIKEVPFDGTSMIDEISKAGIALVLSSQAHKESELMSNRLFESIAAGALIICDENPFAKKFFGDSLLYVDSRTTAEQMYSDIVSHLEWAQKNPTQALAKIEKAQKIFSDHFTLIKNLSDLYSGFTQRKNDLQEKQNPQGSLSVKVRVNLLMPEYSPSTLQEHVKSIQAQEYSNFSSALVVDKKDAVAFQREISAALATSATPIDLVQVEFFKSGIHPEIKSRTRLGEIINGLLESSQDSDAFMLVAPNERLFSNHLAVLCGALQRDQKTQCAATAALLIDGDTPIHTVHELIDFGHVNRAGPTGYGRFIFRTNAIPHDIGIALRHLDGRPLAAMVGQHTIMQQMPASISINVTQDFPERTWDDAAESEIIYHFAPEALNLATGFGPRPRQPVHVATVIEATSLHLMKKLLNRNWIKSQISAIRKHGLKSRFKVLKRKLAL
ncbi:MULTISPECIES: hypothetical protein [unclassified Pseudomonas]|uniref:glycosyltransferase family protein n=1 Tax=unclassified Pseudomonas TaxID=196821 RepID=UPI000876BC39|nr:MULTISPECIES: hypothetical protein [unclassified Pseudomonas]SCZ75399.1 hypothetical protein SAMN03159460_05681 [Pseudomonas sp. NFPP17]SDA88631.1 hypothetical protein SAMN03159464_05973 [Pseudomonas sp. NFPP15]SEL96829.1 hypothetical protein SAMN03159324_05939 [Pseudomonas sp. NFPP18]SFA68102.1 hypothetical protein SAMN03159320_05757 [Pseudomonas sp. NFPP13]SFU11586.1 hypothetical protein SAMN03159492_05880 [Pseudomonas sp. NFPP25]